MAINLKPLKEHTIVITGASSGIGLATARAAAERGARVVLTARNQEALATIADEIKHVADVAIQRFGGFDTWVNDAGVGLYGKLDEVSLDDARRLFDTNYWG